MIDITKAQRLIRKAIKDYSITSKHDEEVLVLFLMADIFKEINGMNVVEQIKRVKKPVIANEKV